MPSRPEAQEVVRRLHALSGGAHIRRKAAARDLTSRHPVDASELLHHLLQLAREGDEPASCVLGAFVQALEQEASILAHAESLRRVASISSLDQVAHLFASGPARREFNVGAAAKADARLYTESLGHLKQKARLTRNLDELARLAVASNPLVVRNALINPRLTEALVVRIAARRPARPEPLIEIWRTPRWSSRHAVQRALVFNPYLPPEVGAKIVPLLNRADLRELADDTSVHPALRAQAVTILQSAADGALPRR